MRANKKNVLNSYTNFPSTDFRANQWCISSTNNKNCHFNFLGFHSYSYSWENAKENIDFTVRFQNGFPGKILPPLYVSILDHQYNFVHH